MFCQKCGKKINDDDIFCAYCGESTSEETMPSGQQPTPVMQPYQANPFIGGGQPEVPSKKGKGLIITVTVLAVLLAAAVGTVLFLLLKDDDSGSSRKKSSSSSSENVSEEAVTDLPETVTYTSTETTTTETSTATTTSTTMTAATETETTTVTTEPQTEPPSLSDDTEAMNEAMFYSTDERPVFEEFDWCYGQSGMITSHPQDAEPITDPLGFNGGWKAMMIYNDGSFLREINNFNIITDGTSASLSIDWYYGEMPNTEPFFMEDSDDTLFTGEVIENGISVDGPAQLILNDFWKADGKEYALGTMNLMYGYTAYVAMVRK
ncbi:MAG: zinc ribbon domain-containing protein [Ruminococcus sp.]|nr:zinc ribbon domain-containing protein [Ruminococcus sp.]